MPLTAYFHVLTVIANSLLHQQQQKAAAISDRNGTGGYSLANASTSYNLHTNRFLLPPIAQKHYGTNDMMDSSQLNSTIDATEIRGPNAADIAVFTVFELLGITGFVGNILLMTVVHQFGYLQKPSFILISSLAIADILHTIVTSTYFYPPIIFGSDVYSQAVTRLYNAIDWSAWGITLSHMMAICIDRLLAIVLFYKCSFILFIKPLLSSTILFYPSVSMHVFTLHPSAFHIATS